MVWNFDRAQEEELALSMEYCFVMEELIWWELNLMNRFPWLLGPDFHSLSLQFEHSVDEPVVFELYSRLSVGAAVAAPHVIPLDVGQILSGEKKCCRSQRRNETFLPMVAELQMPNFSNLSWRMESWRKKKSRESFFVEFSSEEKEVLDRVIAASNATWTRNATEVAQGPTSMVAGEVVEEQIGFLRFLRQEVEEPEELVFSQSQF